jgi:hypothetical protein
MNMTDNLATLKAAEAAGATIQAYTLEGNEPEEGGRLHMNLVRGKGYWRDIEGPVQYTCHESRYRIKPEGEA